MLSVLSVSRAAPSQVVIEIEPAAEPLLDARAARRLVALELADVAVPAGPTGAAPALFYRVLARPSGLLHVELWERGELVDARVVSSAQGSVHLASRRVALAAAELARGLRQKRLALKRREAQARERLQREASDRAARTKEGPIALRSSVAGLRGDELALLGSSIFGELTLHGSTRLDLGARWLSGVHVDQRAALGWFEVAVGPAHRLRLSPSLDLDVSALASAAVVHVGSAIAVDAVASQQQSWTARAAAVLRLQPRITRSLRASVGVETSLLLRSVPVTFPGPEAARFEGLFLGAELGVVVTPP